MNYRGGLLTGIGGTLAVLAIGLAVWWIVAAEKQSPAKATAAPPPATIAKPLKEEQINNVTLTEDAIERLALATAPVTLEKVQRTRLYGGEVVIPPGQAVIVSAPIGGTLKATASMAVKPGEVVQAGQPMFELVPLLTPEGRANLASALVQAEGDANNAATQRDAAKIAMERAIRVFDREAGSRRAVDEAQAQYTIALATTEAALKRKETLESLTGDLESGSAGPITIESPRDGLLRSVSATAGQTVPAGAALFEVVDVNEVWIRVGVYVGDAPEIDAQGEARIGPLSSSTGEYKQTAAPIAAPPSASALTSTVDMFYEFDNRTAKYSPGQRIGVELPLGEEEEALVVPWGAVLHDIYGGTWVYEETGEHSFTRRRVTVSRVADGKAILASGPPPESRIVVAGAAELFGTETGFTK